MWNQGSLKSSLPFIEVKHKTGVELSGWTGSTPVSTDK